MTALDPNRSAQPAEAAILRELLIDDHVELEMLKSRLERAQRLADGAQQKLRAAQEAADSACGMTGRIEAQVSSTIERMDLARGLLHPIRRIPLELLQEIQLWWLHMSSDDTDIDYTADLVPFRAAAVCRSWRSAAQLSRSLWSYPTIQLDMLSKTAKAADVRAAWQIRISAHVERALLTCFTLRLVGHSRETPLWINEHLARLVGVTRIVHVIDSGFPRHTSDDTLRFIMSTHNHWMQEIVLHAEKPQSPIVFAARHLFRSVRSLSAKAWTLDWTGSPTFLQLSQLRISNYEQVVTRTVLSNMTQSMPSLKELKLHVQSIREVDGESLSVSKVVFANIHTLQVWASVGKDVSEWLHFPAVTRAVAKYWNSAATTAASTLDLPHFINTLCDTSISSSTCVTMLKTLRLRGTALDRAAALALRSAPYLETLEIDYSHEGFDIDSNGFFATLGAADGEDTWIAPRLQELVVTGLSDVLESDEEVNDDTDRDDDDDDECEVDKRSTPDAEAYFASDAPAGRVLAMVRDRMLAAHSSPTTGFLSVILKVDLTWDKEISATPEMVKQRIQEALKAGSSSTQAMVGMQDVNS